MTTYRLITYLCWVIEFQGPFCNTKNLVRVNWVNRMYEVHGWPLRLSRAKHETNNSTAVFYLIWIIKKIKSHVLIKREEDISKWTRRALDMWEQLSKHSLRSLWIFDDSHQQDAGHWIAETTGSPLGYTLLLRGGELLLPTQRMDLQTDRVQALHACIKFHIRFIIFYDYFATN